MAPALPRSASDVVLRVGVASALVVDAVVHWRLAQEYGVAFPGGIGGDAVFRIEAVVALLAGVFVLYNGSRAAWAAAFLVLASAFMAVVLYRYVEMPQLGPIPSMYEPIWYREKAISAAAEGAGAALAAAGLLANARRRPAPRPRVRRAPRSPDSGTSPNTLSPP